MSVTTYPDRTGIGGGGGLTDGDKGDIVAAGSGDSLTFDTAVVTAAAKTVLDDANVAAMRTTLGLDSVANYPTGVRDHELQFVIDGGGATITTGVKGYLRCPVAGTIVAARLLGDQSGSIVVDIWKDTYANFPPVDADSITAAAPPTITTATKSEDTTLTGWTTNVAAGDILGFNVDSVTTLQRVTVLLTIRRS